MNNYTFKLTLNDQLVDYLERLAYELEGSKRIIKELIIENPDNVGILNGETFKHYQKAYEENNAKYEIGKKELQNKYIPEKYRISGKVLNWNLDYDSACFAVTVVGDEFANMTSEEFFNVR